MEIKSFNQVFAQSQYCRGLSQSYLCKAFSADSLSSIRLTERAEEEKSSRFKNFLKKTGEILSYPFIKLKQFITFLFCSNSKEHNELKEFLEAQDPLIFIRDHLKTFAKAYDSHMELVMDKVYQFVMGEEDEDKVITGMVNLLYYARILKIKSKISNVDESVFKIINNYILNRVRMSSDQELQVKLVNLFERIEQVAELTRKRMELWHSSPHGDVS